jgi:hypothetical protein
MSRVYLYHEGEMLECITNHYTWNCQGIAFLFSVSCPKQNDSHTGVRSLAALAAGGTFSKNFQQFPVR